MVFDRRANGAAANRRAFRGWAEEKRKPGSESAVVSSACYPASERSECRRQQAHAAAQRRIRRPVHPGRAASRMNAQVQAIGKVSDATPLEWAFAGLIRLKKTSLPIRLERFVSGSR
ncbi:MAG: hypothetical protein H6631_01395 [Anaerolineaceae bacterium]|nr:hypothetical protein [Anaerolineaceae bacterium]